MDPGKRRVAPTAPLASAPADPSLISPAPADTEGAEPALFDRLRAFTRTGNPAIYAALEDGQILSHASDTLRIRVPAAFAARRLQEKSDALAELASRFFGKPTRIEIADEGVDAASTTPPGIDDDLRRKRQVALNDPGVSRALEVLDGEIVEILPFGATR